MKSTLEKNRCHHFEIPGAHVRYQKKSVWKTISHLSGSIGVAGVMRLTALLTVIILTGCYSVFIPHKNQLRQLEDYPRGDCVVQAWRGQVLLQRHNELSRVVCGVVGTTGHHTGHCWNEVYSTEDGQWHLIDLSSISNKDGWPRDLYFEYVSTSYWYGKPTVEDLRFDRSADWYSSMTLKEAVKSLPVGTGPGNWEEYVMYSPAGTGPGK